MLQLYKEYCPYLPIEELYNQLKTWPDAKIEENEKFNHVIVPIDGRIQNFLHLHNLNGQYVLLMVVNK